MCDNLFKKGLVIGIFMILILLNLMPTINSESISIKTKKKFNMLDAEDIKYNDYKEFYDNSVNQFGEFLSNERVNIHSHQKNLFDSFKKDMSLSMKNDLEKIRLCESELNFESLIDDKGYIPHDPINIQNNNDFTEENGVIGGSGTEEDPFIIEGWEINGSGYGIRIYHTTSYFIVRNCRLTGVLAIEFYDVKFGAISTIITDGNDIGAYVRSSSNITIQDSILYGTYGLLLYDSMFISVNNCSASSSNEFYSIYLLDLHFSTLSNMAASEGIFGIYIKECSNTLIRDFDIYNN